jgi:hypothetical protein
MKCFFIKSWFFSIFVTFTQYMNFTSDKVTFSFRRIERRRTVQPTWPPCTMDYDHVKSLAKYYKTFFLQSCTRKLQILLTREHNFVIFVIFHSCLFKIRSVYIRTIYADEKKIPFMYFSLLNGLLRIVNYEFFWHNLKCNCLMCCVLFGQVALLYCAYAEIELSNNGVKKYLNPN